MNDNVIDITTKRTIQPPVDEAIQRLQDAIKELHQANEHD